MGFIDIYKWLIDDITKGGNHMAIKSADQISIVDITDAYSVI